MNRLNQPNGGVTVPGPELRPLPLLLRRAWYGLNQAFRRRIAHLGLTPDQYTVLRTLNENPGLTQRKMTQDMASDPNTVASLVRRMEQAGLLERRSHPSDGRAQQLFLRPAGRLKLNQARRFALTLQQDILEALPAAQRGDFLGQLARVSAECRQAAERESGREPDESL